MLRNLFGRVGCKAPNLNQEDYDSWLSLSGLEAWLQLFKPKIENR